jgi:hypothetical protein
LDRPEILAAVPFGGIARARLDIFDDVPDADAVVVDNRLGVCRFAAGDSLKWNKLMHPLSLDPKNQIFTNLSKKA